MATAVQPAMIMAPSYNQHSQCIDPEQEFFDFSQLPSPTPATLKREASTSTAITSPTSTNIDDDLQTPAKPSHEYERFKQQTGLPSGSIAGLNPVYNSGFGFSSSGIDEMAMMGDSSMIDAGMWGTGMAMDANVNMGGMDFQQPNYLSFNDNAQDDFVDPSSIEEPPQVRVWPGMHQQAALAKAQAQAQAQQQRQAQQQQLALQRQQQQQQQQARAQPTQAQRKTSSPLSDARTEETIARVVAQIRANSQSAASSMGDNHHDLLPHVIRAKKDEEDMDEDERLLASEEGKKLSSKERRQLRNKVSARAFRSRRKEYIGQLEGEVAVKVQEANDLRTENRLLREENARSRAFIERLLRHQAFTPFLDELSREDSLQPKEPIASMPSTSTPAVAAPAPASFPAQQFNAMSQPENTHVGMTLVPETQFDFASLNINNGGNWGVNNGFGYQQPRVFAVHELPEGPVNPLDTEFMSGKGHSAIFRAEDDLSLEEVKADYPVIERPIQSQKPVLATVEEDADEDDLYSYSPAPSAPVSTVAAPLENHENLFTNPEKALSHYTLVIADEAQEALLAERLERRIAAAEPVLQRLAALTSMLDS